MTPKKKALEKMKKGKAMDRFHKSHEVYTDKEKHLKMCKGCDSEYHKK